MRSSEPALRPGGQVRNAEWTAKADEGGTEDRGRGIGAARPFVQAVSPQRAQRTRRTALTIAEGTAPARDHGNGGSRSPARLEGGQGRKERKEKHLRFWVVVALAALRSACRQAGLGRDLCFFLEVAHPPPAAIGPNGAAGCSHGWSGAVAQRPDAEPVGGSGRAILFFLPILLFSPRRGEGGSSAPRGAGPSLTHLSHGLRSARHAAGCAPPAAPCRRSARLERERGEDPRRPRLHAVAPRASSLRSRSGCFGGVGTAHLDTAPRPVYVPIGLEPIRMTSRRPEAVRGGRGQGGRSRRPLSGRRWSPTPHAAAAAGRSQRVIRIGS